MSAKASPTLISYQVSNRVPSQSDVRAYIKRSLAPYVEAAKTAETRKGPVKPAVGTVFCAGKFAVIYTRIGYLAIEGPVTDYDMRLAESGGRLHNSDGRPYYASIQEWCAHIGVSEKDVRVEL